MGGMTPQLAHLIERTRAVVEQDAKGDHVEMADQVGRLKYLADALCVEIEDAVDPDGRGERLLKRMADLNARLDALASRRMEA